MIEQSEAKAIVAEAMGTGLLVVCVVGSGIMASELSAGNAALALLANSAATAAVLVVLVTSLGLVSGAHLNPAVTLVGAVRGTVGWSLAARYVTAQFLGGAIGAALAHGMFEQAFWQLSTRPRGGSGQLIGEFVATFGLMLSIVLTGRHRPQALPAVVGLYIGSAYWFTSSTSFANPAVTLARAFTDTFTGIRLSDVPAFVVVQLLGAYCGGALGGWLAPEKPQKLLVDDREGEQR